MGNLNDKKCVSCEGISRPLPEDKIKECFSQLDKDWEIIEQKKIRKQFKFKNFKEAIDFVNKVAELAERENHHPDIKIHYNKVEIVLWTYVVKGLTENDFIMAAKIDGLII